VFGDDEVGKYYIRDASSEAALISRRKLDTIFVCILYRKNKFKKISKWIIIFLSQQHLIKEFLENVNAGFNYIAVLKSAKIYKSCAWQSMSNKSFILKQYIVLLKKAVNAGYIFTQKIYESGKFFSDLIFSYTKSIHSMTCDDYWNYYTAIFLK